MLNKKQQTLLEKYKQIMIKSIDNDREAAENQSILWRNYFNSIYETARETMKLEVASELFVEFESALAQMGIDFNSQPILYEKKYKYLRDIDLSYSPLPIPSNDILFLSSVFQVLGVEGEVQFDGKIVTINYTTNYGTVCSHFSIETMRKYYNRAGAFISEVL